VRIAHDQEHEQEQEQENRAELACRESDASGSWLTISGIFPFYAIEVYYSV
jgi:hypothetical protein